MRAIDRLAAFKRDFKKLGDIDVALIEGLYNLINDNALPEKYRDHLLSGDLIGDCKCHFKPNLLLICKQTDLNTLRLARFGSCSELFG